VHDPLFVRHPQRVRQSRGHLEGVVHLEVLPPDQEIAQALSLDQLHHDVRHPAVGVGVRVEDGDDGGMRQPTGRLRLAQEPRAEFTLLLGAQPGREQEGLERHTTAHVRVVGEVDDPIDPRPISRSSSYRPMQATSSI
jgi:hypothetical protein